MGVPAFFRWLSRKYPSIVVSCVEDKTQQIDGMKIPVDATQPNPNDVEFDNLYLDMNGIIHPCCHPEDKPAPKDEDEMMADIFDYIDRIFNIVRPRRLLYMAIDGVAPRAKMNQQRSRRFRSAKESVVKKEEIERTREELEARGVELPPVKPSSAHFDNNCITPGTPFMARLAICLQYYVHDRMNNNPAWQGIKVILSDANVPGEGEHKVMDYIRRQRSQPDHDPNTHHCLYGADADLIMLGLATHEPHFTILREEFKPNQPKPCEICGQFGHTMKECTGGARQKEGEYDEMANSSVVQEKQFLFLRLCVLREYLERELKIDGLPFPFDLERGIDDWIFMCFFVGNDFLPHLPSLQIREGAIDRLIRLYKEVVPQTEGYLTHNGKVNLSRVQLMLNELGKVEDEIFKKRRQEELEFRKRQRNKRQERKKRKRLPMGDVPLWTPGGQFAPMPLGAMPSPVQNARQEAYQMRQMATLSANQTAASDLKNWLRGSNSASSSPSTTPTPSPRSSFSNGTPDGPRLGQKRSSGMLDSDSEEEPEDVVKLWEDGWKERYYWSKFGVPPDDRDFLDRLTASYTRGLCWVFGYYYQGCQSWKWFYQFHYAPFASDFRNIGNLSNEFERGTKPFKPLEQLMGVFPAASGNFLPEAWRELMADRDSPIIDFYPTNFKVDLNGKKYLWQGVALLPFVEEGRLLRALCEVYPTLTPDEAERNSLGSDRIFVHRQNRLYPFLKTLYESYNTENGSEPVAMNPQHTNGVRGTVQVDERMQRILDNGSSVKSPLSQFPEIRHTYVMCAKFLDPQYSSDYIFEVKLLPGVKMPERVLRPQYWRGQQNPGSYRPQLGFAPPSQREQSSYRTPEPAHRMIRHSLSDPRGQRYPPPPQNFSLRPTFDQRDSFPSRSTYDQRDSFPSRPTFDQHTWDPRRPPAPSVANWNPLPPPPSHSYGFQGPPQGPPSLFPPAPPQFGPPRDYFMPPRRPPRPSPYHYKRPGGGYPY